MKQWLFFFAGMFLSFWGIGQDLQPDDSVALLNVSVIDYLKKPITGEKISFTSQKTHKVFSGTTDSTGKFHLLIPKDADYAVKYFQFTSEANYDNILTLPEAKDQLLTFNYVVRVQLPEKYVLSTVFFEYNKTTLTSESYRELNQLTQFMKAQKTMIIEIASYTDNVGPEANNLKLSQQQADVIREYLLKHGVHATIIQAKGYGSADPVASNDTPDGRKQNRRTEIHVIRN